MKPGSMVSNEAAPEALVGGGVVPSSSDELLAHAALTSANVANRTAIDAALFLNGTPPML